MPSFDHHSEDFARNWREIYAGLRQSCPVTHTDEHGGYYVVSKAADVLAAFRDSTVFASDRNVLGGGGGVTIPANPFRMGIMEMDPPESTEYRRLLNPWFSRAAINDFRPRIRELVTWCIDSFIEIGTFDVVDDLANPLPALVTLDRIGLPLDRSGEYARILHEAVYRVPGSARRVVWLLEDLQAVVSERQYRPDSLAAELHRAQPGGLPIGDELVVELIYMLLSGGIDSTTALVANVMAHLDDVPTDRARLLADRSLVPTAVQDLIRFYTPATGVARTVTTPVELSGTRLEAGDRVLLAIGSADSDEDKFDRPDRVVVDRSPNPHLGFGSGAHRCLGAELATAEMEILLEEVLDRLPDYRLHRDEVVPYPSIPLVNGYIRMPATFTPGSRRGIGGTVPVTEGAVHQSP